MYSGIPAWKRLIDCSLTTDERISLIATIFSDRGEVEMVKDLSGDDAQSFVNVIDEVLRHFISEVSHPFDSDFSNPPSRRWIF